MAAKQTLIQSLSLFNSVSPISNPRSGQIASKPVAREVRRGVVVLRGYGIVVRVERGHLVTTCGVGNERYSGRFAKINHGLERLVVVGSDGEISLAALRWLADQGACFVMLEPGGTLLATTGPVRPSDVRIRRAQALAPQNGTGFRISRELIDRKLAGQERIARDSLRDLIAADQINQVRSELAEAGSIEAIRFVESRGAKSYWRAWRTVAVRFPEKELPRVPEHWRAFKSRSSELTGSPRLATGPVNAVLNYLYAQLEAECRLALAALGLDPGMGVLHMDTSNRDSLACDLMEPIRPEVDAYVLGWIARQPLKRNWFFEEKSGNCRLVTELSTQLAETASTWARLVAPLAEWMVRQFVSAAGSGKPSAPTRLTQNTKRAVTGAPRFREQQITLRPKNVCNNCGNQIAGDVKACRGCANEFTTATLVQAAIDGRIASHTDEAETKRSRTRHANHQAAQKWSASDQPAWLTEEFYLTKVQPKLDLVSSYAIARQLSVSRGYATQVRQGRTPHPRHWRGLARLAGHYETC